MLSLRLILCGMIITYHIKPTVSQSTVSEKANCLNRRDVCYKDNFCSHTFTLPRSDGEGCPALRETILDLQRVELRQKQLTTMILELIRRVEEQYLMLKEVNKTCSSDNTVSDPCQPNPCSNNGICTPESFDDYSCSCPGCYHGTQCEQLSDPCQPNPCYNNGICTPESCDDYSCSCPGCYHGSQCEQLSDPCQPNPCSNNGTCTQESCDDYSCSCPGCYHGTQCEQLSDPCQPNPCYNNGICTPESCDDYSCSCPGCYHGTQCEQYRYSDPCWPDPCLNGGVCQPLAGSCTRMTCQCPGCVTGLYCQTFPPGCPIP